MEGTLMGLLGAILIAVLAWTMGAFEHATAIPIVVLSAFCGSSAESVGGAMLTRDFTWKNEILNFGNTLIGGTMAVFIAYQTIELAKVA